MAQGTIKYLFGFFEASKYVKKHTAANVPRLIIPIARHWKVYFWPSYNQSLASLLPPRRLAASARHSPRSRRQTSSRTRLRRSPQKSLVHGITGDIYFCSQGSINRLAPDYMNYVPADAKHF